MHIDFFDTDKARKPKHRSDILRAKEIVFTDSYKGFGQDYFDNPSIGVGYGGYNYDGRYSVAAQKMIDHYGLNADSKVLEFGCAKGFVLVEFLKKGIQVAGVDVSSYAVEHAHPEVKPFLQNTNAAMLPFADKTFDLVFSKEVLPHIPLADLRNVIKECQRVSKNNIFFEIQCGENAEELEGMLQWDVTHQVVQTPEWWEKFFQEQGYQGDVHYKVLVSA